MDFEEFADLYDQMLDDPTVWKGAVELTSDKLVDVNKQQLLHGLDNTGTPMEYLVHYDMGGGQYYDEVKRKMNPLAEGRYDMHFTGESFNTMKGYFEGDRFRITGGGWAAAYNRGAVSFAERLAGKIYGVYESPFLQVYRTETLYPLIVDLMKAYLDVT